MPAAALLEVRDRRAEDGVRLVVGLAEGVAVPDLLGDHREPEQPEHLVEPPLLGRDLETGPAGVVVDDLPPGPHPRRGRGLAPELLEELVVTRLDPVGQRAAEIHQRVADGRHLPVEDAGHPQLARATGRGCRSGSRCGSGTARGRRAGAAASQPVTGDQSPRSSVAARASRSVHPPTWRATYPSPRFSSDSAGIAATSTAWRSTSTSHAAAAERGHVVGRRLETQAPPGDRALEPLHHVELRADDRLVATEPDHGGDVREDGGERRLDVVLAAHVVGAPGLRAGRGAAQDEVAARGTSAGTSGSRRRRGTAGPRGCRPGRTPARARAATPRPPRRRTRPPRGPGGSRRGCSHVLAASRCSLFAWARIIRS